MRIVHIGLKSHYTEGMLYQDNILSDIHARMGHDVTFITDTLCFQGNELIRVPEEETILTNGVRLIRFNYDYILTKFISNKIHKVKELYSTLERIKPDVILFHGVCGYELMNVARYINEHPEVQFYVDSHEDFNNTARHLVSKLAYKYIHGYFVKKALPKIKKILFLTLEIKQYLQNMYSIPEEMLEFYPLGGIVVSEENQSFYREKIIQSFNLNQDTIICAHSGKLEIGKRTKELLSAFNQIQDDRMHLFIFGSIPKEQEHILYPMINSNKNVHFLGWKNNTEITDFLAGVDLYCQPGTQSATFQVALCCGCATMVYPYPSHKYLMGEECFYVNSEKDIKEVFEAIIEDQKILSEMKEKSYKTAKKKIDYEELAKRILVIE